MQQITRGDYLKDLITIYIENNLQTDITELYSQFIFQCGEIQKTFTPAQVIKISFSEQESLKLKNLNTCYLAGITVNGHKETFNGSLTFNTRGEVVNYEPTSSDSVTVSGTTVNDCGCQGLRGVFSNCCQPAIKAYFSLNYVPTKLSELQNDTDFVDSVDVAESIAEHNASEEAHPYIQSTLATATEALEIAIQAEENAREEAVSLAISTTEAYADSIVTQATEATRAYADSITSAATSATEAYTDSVLQSTTTAINTTIGDLSQLDTSVKSSIVNAINSEVSARESADNNLQGQIDALAAASDVTDIVGTYAELQAYDTQHLNDNDIIKVLSDSTHQDQPSYYRFDKETDTFSYIGSEDAGYTKAQADAKFVTQTTTINGKALSSDISLDYADVDALSETYETVIIGNTSAIAANTTAIASNTSVIAQHTTAIAFNTTAIASNTSAISTIDGKIPTDASTTNKLVSAASLAASIANFANKDLNNLTSNGEARLHALKAYADNGELLQDTDGLAFIEKYAHSTFDRSKFTVVGSPNITNDGIASGFSGSNYLYSSAFSSDANKWEIKLKFRLNSAPSGTEYIISDSYTNDYKLKGFMLRLYTDKKLTFLVSNETNVMSLYGTKVYDTNVDYYIKALYDGTSYSLYWSTDGINYTQDGSTVISDVKRGSNVDYIYYGVRHIAGHTPDFGFTSGSIDLKQFSITVDGVEVFSGNKTGIDTIKPDNFSINKSTATPTDDGIITGAGSEDYILPNTTKSWSNTFSFSQTFGASGRFMITNKAAAQFHIMTVPFFLYKNVSGALSIYRGSTYGTALLATAYNENEWIDYYATCTSSSTTIDFYQNGNKIGTITGAFGATSPNRVVLVVQSTAVTFDLNFFKIYTDNNLAYQACLKIPYTESKTGSKIVQSVYRDRVKDMAEQFGYANYYTLDEDNGNFTLPQVELYGLIGQRTLRDSYRNGINYWELYSNRDLEQGGSCTSGVEVTFAKPFADTNYVLSVPYSAKSATAFTPTQTGDWIAKGKGLL